MKFDLSDALLTVGLISFIGGIAAWNIPAAAVVLGLICIACAVLVEMRNRSKEPAKSRKGRS